MKAKERQSKFYNAGRRVDTRYESGELVWLSRKYIRTRRPSQKLDFRRIGPFPVDRMIGKNAVRLILPAEYSRIHPVFNVSLIMPYFQKDSQVARSEIPNTDISDREALSYLVNWISVSLIIDHRFSRGFHEYLLRSHSTTNEDDDFWVPLQQISTSLDPFIQRFHEIHWDHHRPNWQEFSSAVRVDKGLAARILF